MVRMQSSKSEKVSKGNAREGGTTAAVRQQGGGMISEADKYNERHGRRSATGGKQPSKPQEKRPQEGRSSQKTEPQQQSAGKTAPQQRPAQKSERNPSWESKVDSCLEQLTKLTSSHHETLDDHEARIYELEKWQKKDADFAKKVAPVIAELQRDKELSDERLEELEDQFWSIWAHHLGMEPAGEPETKTAEKKSIPEPEMKTTEKKSIPESEAKAAETKPASRPGSKSIPSVTDGSSTHKNGPVLIYEYRFWVGEKSYKGLTDNYWSAAQASNGNFRAIWAWYVDDEIDHILNGEEISAYDL